MSYFVRHLAYVVVPILFFGTGLKYGDQLSMAKNTDDELEEGTAKISPYDDRYQVILGSMLGNGFICKGRRVDYFCMRHSTKYAPWLKVKANELVEFGAKTPYYQYKTTLTWRSACNQMFTDLRGFCYKEDQKIVTMKWLDLLRDLAIAVWFGDSGTMTGRGQKNACLRTQSFGYDGNKIIERYFNEVGIPCGMNKCRDSYVIVFTLEGTQNLFALIANAMPSSQLVHVLPMYNK